MWVALSHAFISHLVAIAPKPVATLAPQGTPSAAAQMAQAIAATRHFKGDARAPVTLIEVSDFQ